MIEVRRHLHVPPAAVWRALIDVTIWPEWGPSVAGATIDGGATLLSEGARGVVRTSVGISLPFVVTEWVPGLRWSWRVAGIPATSHAAEPAPDGGTRAAIGVSVWAPAYAPLCWVALSRIATAAASHADPPAGPDSP